MPEVREAQAEMAREAGIEGFMYWHYWLGNGRVLLNVLFWKFLKAGNLIIRFVLDGLIIHEQPKRRQKANNCKLIL